MGVREGSGQHSPHLHQAPSAKSTWPGPSAAPPELYRQRGAADEKGSQGFARNLAGGLRSQVKCHRRVSVNRGVFPLWENFGQRRMGCLSSCRTAAVLCQSAVYSFQKSCCTAGAQGGNLLGK